MFIFVEFELAKATRISLFLVKMTVIQRKNEYRPAILQAEKFSYNKQPNGMYGAIIRVVVKPDRTDLYPASSFISLPFKHLGLLAQS